MLHQGVKKNDISTNKFCKMNFDFFNRTFLLFIFFIYQGYLAKREGYVYKGVIGHPNDTKQNK